MIVLKMPLTVLIVLPPENALEIRIIKMILFSIGILGPAEFCMVVYSTDDQILFSYCFVYLFAYYC